MSNAQRYRNRLAEAQKQAQMRDEYHAMEERVAELEAERDRLREALESHVRGLDAMRRLINEGRGASGKLEDIRTAIIYERANAVAALQEAGDE